MLGQPLFRLRERRPEARWQAVVNEAEPRDERRRESFMPAFRPPPGSVAKEEAASPWRRLDRDKLVAALADGQKRWRRVALVCGAGLGKTTNLDWLEAAVNRQQHCRGKQLAVGMGLHELPESAEALLALLMERLQNRFEGSRVELGLRRLRSQGRITFLLDSLDQAGASPDGPALHALAQLLDGLWSACPVWVSGRPHAFRLNRPLFLEGEHWQFIRVGQLDEPECRFLLDDARAAAVRRREGS